MNNKILEFEDFEEMSTFEVYVYYDRPLLFSCIDLIGNKYLAVLAVEDEDTGEEEWLYVQITEERFQMIKSGKIDFRTVFSEPEYDCFYFVYPSKSSASCFDKSCMKNEWLPKRGFGLNAL